MTREEWVEKLRVDAHKKAREMAEQSLADDLGVTVDEIPELLINRNDPNFPVVPKGPGAEKKSWDGIPDDRVIAGMRQGLASGESLAAMRTKAEAKISDPERLKKLLYGLALSLAGGSHEMASNQGLFLVLGLEETMGRDAVSPPPQRPSRALAPIPGGLRTMTPTPDPHRYQWGDLFGLDAPGSPGAREY
jgi:hypothetical protein